MLAARVDESDEPAVAPAICVSIGRSHERHVLSEHKHLAEQGARLVELRLDYITGDVPVRHLLSGKTFAFSDRGEHEMKGFDDAVRLYDVRWRNLDITEVVEGREAVWVDKPDLTRVEEIGFTDLMRGAGHGSGDGNEGVFLAAASVVQTTGSGNLTVTGTGDGQGSSNVGIELTCQVQALGSGKLIVGEISGATDDQLRVAMDSLKKKSPSHAIMLGAAEEEKVSFVAAVSDDLIAKGLKAGDWIYVYTDNYQLDWVVQDIRTVPGDDSSFIFPTEDTRITLYTCTGRYNPLTRRYSQVNKERTYAFAIPNSSCQY